MDHGAPVSIFTVSRELGHGSEALVKRIYGYLGTVRHRSLLNARGRRSPTPAVVFSTS